MIERGETAPDFELPDQDGNPVRLSDLRGRPVVLYFYPKAGTPGCTAQACGVRDHAKDYKRAGAVVLGVSRDPVEKLRAFRKEHRLRHTLLSDQDHAVAEAYGAWVEKTMYGRKHMGFARSTFVIDPGGRVAHVIARANPRTHDREVLEALGAAAA